jgi:hypothetical protein
LSGAALLAAGIRPEVQAGHRGLGHVDRPDVTCTLAEFIDGGSEGNRIRRETHRLGVVRLRLLGTGKRIIFVTVSSGIAFGSFWRPHDDIDDPIRVRLSHNALTDSELKRKKVRIMC